MTYSELIRSGLSHPEIVSRVRMGTLKRIRRGVYGAAEELSPETQHLRLVLATMPGVDPGNVLSHQSAAVLHGLPVPRGILDHVAMIRRSSGHTDHTPQLRVRATRLLDSEVGVVDGLPVTTLARTAVDLARTLGQDWGVAACDAALRLGLPRDELLRATRMHRRLRGLPLARAAADFADPRAESPAESISRVRIALAGLPTPVPQFNVHDQLGVWVARCDFGWPEYRLVGEMDGKFKYGSLLKPGQTPEQAIMAEKRREEAIRAAGFWIVRFDWDMLWRDQALARHLRQALRIQGWRPGQHLDTSAIR